MTLESERVVAMKYLRHGWPPEQMGDSTVARVELLVLLMDAAKKPECIS